MARWRLLYFGIRKVCCLLISWKGVQQLIQPCMLQHWNMYKLPSHILACWDKVSCSSMIMLSHTWPLYFENSCNILGGRKWSIHLIVLTGRTKWCSSLPSSQWTSWRPQISEPRESQNSDDTVALCPGPQILRGERQTSPVLRQVHQSSWQLRGKIRCPPWQSSFFTQ